MSTGSIPPAGPEIGPEEGCSGTGMPRPVGEVVVVVEGLLSSESAAARTRKLEEFRKLDEREKEGWE